jgi:uncharacterized membrane protein YdfJ with MMPL/SSD domain
VSIRHSLVLIVLFVALTVPCAFEAAHIETTATQQEMMPRNSEASDAYSQMVALFGAGALFPFQMLIEPADGVVESAAFFKRAQQLVRRTLDLADASHLLNATGVMLSGDTDAPFPLLHEALHADEARCAVLAQLLQRPICAYARAGWAQYTNGNATFNATATFVSISPAFDPFSKQGTRVIARLRAALAQIRAESSEQPPLDTVGLVGGAIAMDDSVALVYAYFPMMVGITLAVVFALLAVAFRSLVVPLRAVVTITMSVAISMGLAWLVYGRGWLDELHWPSIARRGSLAWSAPVLSFPIMVGLGLDYDIFLLGGGCCQPLLRRTRRARVHARAVCGCHAPPLEARGKRSLGSPSARLAPRRHRCA